MMKTLIYKEIRLAMHPTVPIFIALSAMLTIPNYPYYVTFFYSGLALFFVCLGGRENNDVVYTLNLPVRKKDIVGARFVFAVLIELAQLIAAIPFAALRQSFSAIGGNQVGMDANIALFGLSLIMLGLFNFIFFSIYYKDVSKVGKAFLVSSTIEFLYITVLETLTHIVPLLRDKLDTKDPQFICEKLITLAVGLAVFALLTFIAYRKSVKNFDKYDL